MQASKHFQPVYGTAQDDDVSGYLSSVDIVTVGDGDLYAGSQLRRV